MSIINKLKPPIYIKAMQSDLDHPDCSLYLEHLSLELKGKQADVILNYLKNCPYKVRNYSYSNDKLCTSMPLIILRQILTPPAELVLEKYVCNLTDEVRDELNILSTVLAYTRDWRSQMVDEVMIGG